MFFKANAAVLASAIFAVGAADDWFIEKRQFLDPTVLKPQAPPQGFDPGNYFRFDAEVGKFASLPGFKSQHMWNAGRKALAVFGRSFKIDADGQIGAYHNGDPVSKYRTIQGISLEGPVYQIIGPKHGEGPWNLGYASRSCKIGFPSSGGRMGFPSAPAKTHVNFMCDKGFGTRLSAFAISAIPVQRSPFAMWKTPSDAHKAKLSAFNKTVRPILARRGIHPSFSVIGDIVHDHFLPMGEAILMHSQTADFTDVTVMGTNKGYSGDVGVVYGLPLATVEKLQSVLLSPFLPVPCGNDQRFQCDPFLRLVVRQGGRWPHWRPTLYPEQYPLPLKKKDSLRSTAVMVEWYPHLVPLSSLKQVVQLDAKQRFKIIYAISNLLWNLSERMVIGDLDESHLFLNLSLPSGFNSKNKESQLKEVLGAVDRLKPSDVKIFGVSDFAWKSESAKINMVPRIFDLFIPLTQWASFNRGDAGFLMTHYLIDMEKRWKLDRREGRNAVTRISIVEMLCEHLQRNSEKVM